MPILKCNSISAILIEQYHGETEGPSHYASFIRTSLHLLPFKAPKELKDWRTSSISGYEGTWPNT